MVPSLDTADKTPALTTIDESLNTGQRDSGNGDISNSRSCPRLWACAQRLAAVKVQGTPPPPPPPPPPPRTLLGVQAPRQLVRPSRCLRTPCVHPPPLTH